MRSAEIRERFLQFFEDRGHLRMPNVSLVPENDPSLLFTVAGMVPLKPYLSGQRTPPSGRLVSVQRCFRGSGLNMDDIAEVGDTTHNTLFEMLGNWSIGDYFKERAITFAWELLTGEFGLDPQRLWPSIYPDDIESEQLWRDMIGVSPEKVCRFTDNWWQAGSTGPCGYDSEIYFDNGGPCTCGRADCTPETECGGDRWVEIWNLVFMEFNQLDDGTREPLPQKCVDTGMGMERISGVVQGVRTIYGSDLFVPILEGLWIRTAAEDSPSKVRSLNVLADHVRAIAFLIADGVLPSNESRGYVLRRVIRRAALHARRAKLEDGLAPSVADVVLVMGEAYPELVAHQSLIERTLTAEEESFEKTVEAGAERLEGLLAAGASQISGEEAFRLYDTYGLPIELTSELAAEKGAAVDLDGFRAALEEQRDRSRGAQNRVGFELTDELPAANFVGYETLEAQSTVTWVSMEGDTVIVDPTPFYAEAGGQIGDTGTLTWPDGRAKVLDSFYAQPEVRALRVDVEYGELTFGTHVTAIVDAERRGRIARHHSATHLLHKALRSVLGETVVQRGSLVGPEHTTFDFSFDRALTPEEIVGVEALVNDGIRHNYEREVAVLPIAEARETGAVALFGEKYGETVRVVDFGGWARELCGGTHVTRSGDIGAAIIVSETSIGQGTRRIEMVVGEAAQQRWRHDMTSLRETARALRVPPDEVPERVVSLQTQVKQLQKGGTPAVQQSDISGVHVDTLAGVELGVLIVDESDPQAVVTACDRIFAERLGAQGVAVAVGLNTIAVKCGPAATGRGHRAGDLALRAAQVTGGRGGGRDDFARGGIKDPSRRAEAVATIRSALS